jgi:adenylate cyclase
MTRRGVEIERKWLVDNPPKLSKRKAAKIIQGYISIGSDAAEVRLRRRNGRFFQTIKTGEGLQRGEIEISLSGEQFKKLWPATRDRRLEKVRYSIKWRGRKIELDVYKRELTGLMIAEVEFRSRRQAALFSPPSWFGREVTNDRKYKNASLASREKRK